MFAVSLSLSQTSSGQKRMVWKMDINLTQPAVASMGNLDPYDGLVTCTLLQQAAAQLAAAQKVAAQQAAAAQQGPPQQASHSSRAAVAAGQGGGATSSGGPAAEAGVLQAGVDDFSAMVEARYRRYEVLQQNSKTAVLSSPVMSSQVEKTSGIEQCMPGAVCDVSGPVVRRIKTLCGYSVACRGSYVRCTTCSRAH